MSELSVADVFCGPGGMSLGFRHFFDVTLAVDHQRDPCKTYADNIGGNVKQEDVRNLSGVRGDFDGITAGVIGGTPCKPFSKLNHRRKPDDPRINLWKSFFDVVEDVKPRFFLMENVPTIFAHVKEAIINRARRLGFLVSIAVIDASDYGVAQRRKRWIIVGTRKPFIFPNPTHETPATVSQVFNKIPVELNQGFANSRSETLDRLSAIPSGKWSPISTGTFANAIRLEWNQPSPTVVNISKVYMVHPSGERLITETEAAALQDFPVTHQFHGFRRSRCQQIADAAPQQLMLEIAKQIYSTQFKEVISAYE